MDFIFFSTGHIRKEAQFHKRCPIYTILKQLQEMVGNKKACIIIQGEDLSDDLLHSYESVALLLKYLNPENQYTIIFMKYTAEQLTKFLKEKTFPHKGKELFYSLFEKADAIVYGQGNYYVKENFIDV